MEGAEPTIGQDLATPFITADAALNEMPLGLLEAEIGRLQKLIGADQLTAAKFSALSERINAETTALQRLNERLIDAANARTRINALQEERKAAYVKVFEAIVAEQAVLEDLYSPLMARLAVAQETLRKLAFSVRRVVDIKAWATKGEELFDLRMQGPLRGRGSIEQRAEGPFE